MGLKVAIWLLLSTAAPAAIAALPAVKDAQLQACLQEHAAQNRWSEPQDVTFIRCHNRGVATLDGIEAFPQIRELSLYGNRLESVELRRFAHLLQVNVARNRLRHLILEDLPLLEKCYFFANALTAMELRGLPALREFKGNDNRLTSFTYRGLPAVQKVYLFNNQLPTIDIDQLPALVYMDVRENPMPDELYERMDARQGVTFLHDGNVEDW